VKTFVAALGNQTVALFSDWLSQDGAVLADNILQARQRATNPHRALWGLGGRIFSCMTPYEHLVQAITLTPAAALEATAAPWR